MTKKGEDECCLHLLSLYGRFLNRTASIATPIMTMAIITAAIPNSRLANDAKPETGEAVGAVVGTG